MNLNFKKEFKNPFKKFLTNIFLGISLLIVAFGGTIFGSQIFNSNKVADSDVNAGMFDNFRIWIAQKMHYNSNGSSYTGSDTLVTNDGIAENLVYVVNASDGPGGTSNNLSTQGTRTDQRPDPGYNDNSTLKLSDFVPHVKFNTKYFSFYGARNIGAYGADNNNVFESGGTIDTWKLTSSYNWNNSDCVTYSTFISTSSYWTQDMEVVDGDFKEITIARKVTSGHDAGDAEFCVRGSDFIVYMEGVSVSLTFNTNGGSGGTSGIVAIFNEYFPKITKPTRSGYTFTGYYTKASGGEQIYDANGYPTKRCEFNTSQTLYAHWEEGVLQTVTLNRNGGSGGPASVSIGYNKLPSSSITCPTKSGYYFQGYYTTLSSADGYRVYSSSGAPAGPCKVTTLYARWMEEPNKVILYNMNDGLANGTNTNLLYLTDDLPSQVTYNKYSNIFTINGNVPYWQTVLGYTSTIPLTTSDKYQLVY